MFIDYDDWESYFLEQAAAEGWVLVSLGTRGHPLLVVGNIRGDVGDSCSVERFRRSYLNAAVHAITAYRLIHRHGRDEFECLGMAAWSNA